MAQGSEFPLRKPSGFHHDFFLLGITTFLAGLLGLPAPNGLIPQAPIHTKSLVARHPDKREPSEEEEMETVARTPMGSTLPLRQRTGTHSDYITKDEWPGRESINAFEEAAEGVVEQRVSNLAQGSLCLVLLTGPFLHVLNLIPRGALYPGHYLFPILNIHLCRRPCRPFVCHPLLLACFHLSENGSWHMGVEALRGNGITRKILYFFRDKSLTPANEPLRKVRKSRILMFLVVQLVGFGATFAITQTIGLHSWNF
jgi:hypothetical protein